ncbi:MAG: nucleotide sugar dehydrogenase [Candidatus Omnitrophica bacterium]|nr:nucleotide sugar dehydrogenase [Candidatus Omnitrophota bacterium]
MFNTLKTRIASKQAKIAVIGLGYVGLPLAISFAQKGFKVFGIDTNPKHIERLNQGESYITDVRGKDFSKFIQSESFVVSTEFGILHEADAVIICVPTPIKRKYTPDVSYMLSAIRSVAKHLHQGMLIVLESTTYPGTTEELIQPELEKSGLKVGRDFHLAFSPERIDPGNKNFDVTQIPKVVGGITAGCTELTTLLYGQVIKHVHPVSSAKAAEMTKLLENSFRIVNIGWINEIAQTCHKMGIDVWEVIEAAKTKPFGFMPFYPGLGVGGHCIPEDPLYLYWKAKRYGVNSKFIKLAADTNAHMPNYVIHRIEASLSKPLSKCKILVVGVTYKKDVKDLRKSPSIRLVELLKHQSQVDYYDPLVPFLKVGGIDLNSVALDSKSVKSYDCVVMAVDHTAVNYDLIRKNARRIFDVRNIYKNFKDSKIERL